MKSDGAALTQAPFTVLDSVLDTAARRTLTRPVHLVCGRAAVVQRKEMLVELSRRTGQAGAMDWLDHFVASPDSLRKVPCLLLAGRRGRWHGLPPAGPASADDLEGAVLIYEYQVAGRGTKVFATDDVTGGRTVIAPGDVRAEVAGIAIRRLMRMGAVVALISIDGLLNQSMNGLLHESINESTNGLLHESINESTNGLLHKSINDPMEPGPDPEARPISTARPAYWMARRTRLTPRYLPLAGTVAETLARLGDDTRRNFRRYRRRAEQELGAGFVADLQMRRGEFLEMNRRSTNPAPEEVAEWRYDLIERTTVESGRLFAGVRAGDGRWLSLIGGRRHSPTTEIDWQMNLAGLPRYSLSTVMRAYLLEHEIARGTRNLAFEGGTPHPMRHSFVSAETTDMLAVRRWSARAWLLRRFSPLLLPDKNFLGAALRDETMRWD